MADWSVDDSKQTYCIQNWGEGYFDISPDGHCIVRPYRDPARGEISLKPLLEDIQQQMSLPVLIRFQDILRDRVNQLGDAFGAAFNKHAYDSRYTSVYPIKVNQQYSVVSEILKHGGERVGLEAGSKPELMAVLSLADAEKNVIVCNGYKDREYIRVALIARKLGHRIFIVIEKTSELQLVLEEAENIGVDPLLGLRLRLSSIGKGKWQNTGGEKAKFGLSATQILHVANTLIEQGKQHWIQMLHFHMGSQIANLDDIRSGLAEASQYFVELHKKGAEITVLDIGGGIGVDYEGTASKQTFSVNYTLNDYADAVVDAFKQACVKNSIATPEIITEAGRAMSAHHAVLITEVVDAEQRDEIDLSTIRAEHPLLQRAMSLYEDSKGEDPELIYAQVIALFRQAQIAFTKGELGIDDRAELDRIYLASFQQLKKHLTHNDEAQQNILNEINEKLADKLVCNLSVFQSIPDVWGIEQIFPIVPLQRLNEHPQRRAILQDLTCDSDGQIESYVDRYGIETSLPVHQIQEKEQYCFGIFMVGAYQEILGDMHNLFGDTNTINVVLDKDGDYHLDNAETGDTVRELLNYVHFDTGNMMKTYREKIESAQLESGEAEQYLSELLNGLEGYTYLE